MIARVDQGPAPLRLVLGRGAYDDILATLSSPIAAIEALREPAYSVDHTGRHLSKR